MQASASRLLVSTVAPHLILAVETSLPHLLGYAPHELVGKDFRILQGTETDTELLGFFFLENASMMHSRISLYERYGRPAMMEVSCEPLFSTSANRRCILVSLTASDIMTPGEALGESTVPCVLLSAEWPHRVEMANQRFAEMFGVAVQDIVNKSYRCMSHQAVGLHRFGLACADRRGCHTRPARRAEIGDLPTTDKCEYLV
jgi:hypothetical protein